MKNVEMSVDGNILTIKVDLTKDFGRHGLKLPALESKGRGAYYVIA